jgi:hypothetical protein
MLDISSLYMQQFLVQTSLDCPSFRFFIFCDLLVSRKSEDKEKKEFWEKFN